MESTAPIYRVDLLTLSIRHYSGLIPHYSNVEAWKREMWGGRDPTQEEADQLGACFEWEWMRAVESSKLSLCRFNISCIFFFDVHVFMISGAGCRLACRCTGFRDGRNPKSHLLVHKSFKLLTRTYYSAAALGRWSSDMVLMISPRRCFSLGFRTDTVLFFVFLKGFLMRRYWTVRRGCSRTIISKDRSYG